ncbi:MAG: acetate--CoA ligase family protein, partial [Elusimicrobiota bacterium]|nr:acetate--CoA ligase family protein [Elusimicrobiota bacterium]
MDFINNILSAAAKNGQQTLNEADCYAVFNRLGLKTPKFKVISPKDDILAHIKDFAGGKVVIKILSSKTLHKTDKGGVKVAAKEEAAAVYAKMTADFPEIDTFMLVEFADYPHFALGREILLGARADKAFGPLITLGVGGTDAENLTKKFKQGVTPAITPVNGLNAAEFVANSFIWSYTGGLVRGGKEQAKKEDLVNWVAKISQVMAHFSGESKYLIEELEINPLAAVDGRLTALDGVLRFKLNDGKRSRKIMPTKTGIKALLEPKTAAVAGVSGDKVNMGRIILRNAIEAGFNKDNLFILKKDSAPIDGINCYASCKDFPKKVDMFVVTVPAAGAAEVLKDAAQSANINGFVLIS